MNSDYKIWIKELKSKIHSVQVKAALAVNSALIQFYFELGKSISEKENIYGAKLIEQTSKDLREEFPDMTGFSERNLIYCRRFYQFYSPAIPQQVVAELQLSDNHVINRNILQHQENSQQAVGQFTQQLVAKIPWGHNISKL